MSELWCKGWGEELCLVPKLQWLQELKEEENSTTENACCVDLSDPNSIKSMRQERTANYLATFALTLLNQPPLSCQLLSSDKQKRIRLQAYNKTILKAVVKQAGDRNLQSRWGYRLGFRRAAGIEECHLPQCRRRHGHGCNTTLQYTQLKGRTRFPLHFAWGTRLCQALLCRGWWIQGEFCLVLVEPLNSELANLQRRSINTPIKKPS